MRGWVPWPGVWRGWGGVALRDSGLRLQGPWHYEAWHPGLGWRYVPWSKGSGCGQAPGRSTSWTLGEGSWRVGTLGRAGGHLNEMDS